MSDGKEYDPAERQIHAMENLFTQYTTPGNASPNMAVILTALSLYRQLCIHAAVQTELTYEQRLTHIRDGLMADAIVDPTDEERATKQVHILEEAYETNREQWDTWIERQSSFMIDRGFTEGNT